MQNSALPPQETPLLPVRMLNEYAYCPRLFYLMHVEGRWEENEFTLDGSAVHRRVDKLDHVLPDADTAPDESLSTTVRRETEQGDEPPVISRSAPLASEALGLTAKLDLVSSDGSEAVPVETKRGRVPRNPERSHEPERVQLMAQGLLLREHGYECNHGVLYFAESRKRVDVPFTVELETATLAYLGQARLASGSTTLPPPLDDSPKCVGCSLNAICLPDETMALNVEQETPREIRRLYPVRVDATPFYVQEHGAVVGKSSATLIVRKEGKEIGKAALKDMSQLVLCGNVMVTAQAFHLLCERNIPVVHSTMGNWFYGVTAGFGLRNSYDRAAQFEMAADSKRCLEFAKGVVEAKGLNQRTMIRRNGNGAEEPLDGLARLIKRVSAVESAEALLGLEGAMAGTYFGSFSGMLRSRQVNTEFDFSKRNRRPPLDPVNTMLSFCYSLLAKEFTVALYTEGLDPWWGFYHKPRNGRPALALDMMEPYRPLIADSAVITAINTGMIRNSDFTRSKAGCMLKDTGRKAMIKAFEARLDHLITHPEFGYRCSWRSALRVQVRLLARYLRKDIPEYKHIVTR